MTDSSLIYEAKPKKDFSVSLTSCSNFDGNRFALICPYATATAGKSDVKKRKRESYCVLTNSPEIQVLQAEEMSKACGKL